MAEQASPADMMVAVVHLVLHKQVCPQFTRVIKRRRVGLAQQSSDSQRMFRLECVYSGKVGIRGSFWDSPYGIPICLRPHSLLT